MINNPKDFFQQIQNLCEELGLKMKAISESIAGFISKSDAESTYLKKADAQSTYLGKTAKAESAKTADTATSATSATKAMQDGNGAVISSTYLKTATASSTYLTKSDAQATYLGKDAKAQSATFADSATTATSASSALKATQDADGNVISGTYLKNANAESTYLKKSDASSTYLGKTAKAASASTADSATKAIQDGNGANIASTYVKTVNGQVPVNGNVNIEIPEQEVDTENLVVKSGDRGELAGYETPLISADPVVITNDSPDSVQVTSDVGIIVERGETGTSWTKTVSITNMSAFITLGDDWVWSGGVPPTITDNAILVLHWCNNVGVASLVEGAANAATFTGTIIHEGLVGWYTHIWRDGECIYTIGGSNATVTAECALAVGDTFTADTKQTPSASTYVSDPGEGVIAFSNMNGITISNYEVTTVANGFSVFLELY